MDLLTRGAGFGYLGSTITSLIYASLHLHLLRAGGGHHGAGAAAGGGLAAAWCYVLSSLVVLPLAMRGIT
jgi:hypothetical protein